MKWVFRHNFKFTGTASGNLKFKLPRSKVLFGMASSSLRVRTSRSTVPVSEVRRLSQPLDMASFVASLSPLARDLARDFPSAILAFSVAASLHGVRALLARANLLGRPSAFKPFASFSAFYPFYLSQHAKPRTKLLHVVGTLCVVAAVAARPRLGLALAAGAAVGFTAFPLLRRLDNGAVEMVATLGTYVYVGAALTGSIHETLAVPVAAYFFAWVAHFLVEKNRPATFIYPVFSLVGDFCMCAEVLVGRHAVF